MGKRWILVAMMFCWLHAVSMAQDVPTQIDSAVQALGAEVGQSLTLANITNWRWQTAQFNDASLGCGAADDMAAQVIVQGFIFFLEYQGETYEVHVSQDGQNAVVCSNESDSEMDMGSGMVEAGGYSNTLCPLPAADEPTFPRSRVTLNLEVVAASEIALRDQPSPDAGVISTIVPNTRMFVFSGPQCAAGRVWWQVDVNGTLGWLSEVEDGAYTVNVRSADPLPTTTPITAANVPTLAQLSALQGNFFPRVAWSSDGTQLAIAGDRGLDSVVLYSGDLLQPTYIEQSSRPTDIIFRTTAQQMLVSRADGGVHLWDISSGVEQELFFLQTHEQTQALAFNSVTGQFASSGLDARTDRQVDRSFAISLWSIDGLQALNAFAGHTAVVLNMAFSPDGQTLVAVDANGSILIHPANTPGNSTQITGITGRSVAYSSNGQFLAIGNVDGTITILNAADNAFVATYAGHLSEVTALSFSPDNTLLVSSSTDGTVRVWNTQSDALLAVLELTEGGVFDVAVSPDGRLIAAATDDNTVRLLGVAGN